MDACVLFDRDLQRDLPISSHQPYVSQLGDHIALEEIHDGIWYVYYFDLLLARVDERDGKLQT